MRLRHVITPLAVGLAARAIVRRRRARRAAARDSFANDPRDPVQGLDEASELQGEPLDVDAMSRADVEAADDLAGLETELDETAELDGEVVDALLDEPTRPRDAGDLYGAHTPAAVDREHPDDDRAFSQGQNWIEALETDAVEGGPEPERELDDIVDDEDVLDPPHPSDTHDRPIADHGAGGRRGL